MARIRYSPRPAAPLAGPALGSFCATTEEFDIQNSATSFVASELGGTYAAKDLGPSPALVSDEEASRPRELTDRGLANLRAFAAILGYVRYFHPSDEAAAMETHDWERFSIEGVRRVEAAPDSVELARVLLDHFEPIAPSALIWAEGHNGIDHSANFAAPSLAEDVPLHVVWWSHFGLGIRENSVYRSERKSVREDDAQRPDKIVDPAHPRTRPLPGGVAAIVSPNASKRSKSARRAPLQPRGASARHGRR